MVQACRRPAVRVSPIRRAALADMSEATTEQFARQFKRGRAGTVQPLLESLTALGKLAEVEQHEQPIADVETLMTQLERGGANGS